MKRPEIWRRGDPLTAAKLNQTVNAVDATIVRPEYGREIIDQRPTVTRQFMIYGTEGTQDKESGSWDILLCKPYPGVQAAESVKIMRPWHLRCTPFLKPYAFDDNGTKVTIRYTYEKSQFRYAEKSPYAAADPKEWQVITPRYTIGDIIYATKYIHDATTSTINPITGTEYIEWVDDNRDGRAWAALYSGKAASTYKNEDIEIDGHLVYQGTWDPDLQANSILAIHESADMIAIRTQLRPWRDYL